MNISLFLKHIKIFKVFSELMENASYGYPILTGQYCYKLDEYDDYDVSLLVKLPVIK